MSGAEVDTPDAQTLVEVAFSLTVIVKSTTILSDFHGYGTIYAFRGILNFMSAPHVSTTQTETGSTSVGADFHFPNLAECNQDAANLSTRNRPLFLIALGIILLVGTFLRFHPSAGFTRQGFDEVIYTQYVGWLGKNSILDYPDLCKQYLQIQSKEKSAILTPTRFTYPYFAHLLRQVTGGSAYGALVNISAIFTTLTLLVAAIFCLRMSGPAMALGVSALLSVGMNQVQQAQHAMIDGFFTFWTIAVLWTLWECLQKPGNVRWLVAHGASLAILVMTKENSFFVFIGICGLLVCNRWLRFGVVSRSLLMTVVGGAAIGFVILVCLSGGIRTFMEMYRLLIAKSVVLDYAIKNNDGPWHRYLIELLLVSPLVCLLACGQMFRLRISDKAGWFLALFVLLTYAVMANVKYGMNLRYATIWDLPLRYLAFAQLMYFVARIGRRQVLVLTVATLLVCASELHQYVKFCVNSPAYALVPNETFRAARIWK